MPPTTPPHVECIIPILAVRDLPTSLRFYTQTLGFSLDWQTPTMASVSHTNQPLMLCQNAQGHPGTWLWIGLDDIQPLHNHLLSQNIPILLPPTNYHFAYEFRIQDPDTHTLRFGSSPKLNLPFATPT